MTGYRPGDPQSEAANRLVVSGTFAGQPAKGTLREVEVAIGEGAPWVASQAVLEVDRIVSPQDSGYGSDSGRISDPVCPSNPMMMAPCRLFEARFSTRVQFNS